MFAFIKGILYKKSSTEAVIEAGGIGYIVFISANTAATIGSAGESVMLYTYMKVAEDSISLYGFLSEEEQNMFHNLISVNGIGPKNAMQILSYLTPDKIIFSVMAEDTKALSEAPGIGKKTAARMIIDLKDKFKSIELPGLTPQQTIETAGGALNDAIDALVALGYSQSESARAVSSVAQEGLTGEQLIKLALKRLASI